MVIRRKNFKPFTEETVAENVGKLVGVHWNAHENCWSVVSFKSRKSVGKVIGHTSNIVLHNISFAVDKTKKQNALEKGSKDRHTFVVGIFSGVAEVAENELSDVKLKYQKDDNENPFIGSDGHNMNGHSVVFMVDSKVIKIKSKGENQNEKI